MFASRLVKKIDIGCEEHNVCVIDEVQILIILSLSIILVSENALNFFCK